MTGRTDIGWDDGRWHSADGLSLHYRDHAGPADRPAILCLPGLTRNARDFEPLAECFAGQWRVIAVDFRGRGDSDYARDTSTYVPATYVADMLALLDQLGLERVVTVGTSLGGIVSVLLANARPQAIAGMVINDIGPVIEAKGLERIRDYVGQGRSFPTWMHAARALAESQGPTFPQASITDWLAMAKRCMVVGSNGRIHFDYDMKIAEPFATADGASNADLWPAFRALAGRPVTLLRGGLSDVLTGETFARMGGELAGADSVTVPNVGHAPVLTEPAAAAAIDRLLARVAAG